MRAVTRVTAGAIEDIEDAVAVERALEIRVDGRPLAVTLRTPGDDRDLAIGFLAVLVDERFSHGPDIRLFWMIGILGGYTTFSTFGYETVLLVRAGSHAAALVNVAGQVVLGLLAVWAGAAIARGL